VANNFIPPIASMIRRGISEKELDSILNHLPNAALILDYRNDLIYSCNLNAVEMTGLTKEQIRNTSFFTLFPRLPKNIDLSINTKFNTLLQKQNELCEVNLEFHNISSNKPILLVTVETEEDIHHKELQKTLKSQRTEALLALSLAPLNDSLENSIRQMLQSSQILTGSSFLAVYLPDEKQLLNLEHSRGKVDFLPKSIKQSQISHLRIPYIWQPGTRATSVLHQQALAAKLTYLATCPIDQSLPLNGILVIGDQISQPPEDLVSLLQISTGTLLSCITHYQQLDQMKNQGHTMSSQLNIMEVIKDSIADGLIFTNDKHIIVEVNSQVAAEFGYTQRELVGKPISQILISDFDIIEALNSISRDQTIPHEVGEVKVNRRNGRAMLTHMRIVPFPKSNQPISTAIILSDLSAREEYRVRAKQLESQAILGEVMAIFAHEVRNPINNISMGLEVLASNFSEKDVIQDEIGRLRSDIDRLEDLMKSVLSVSRTREYKMERVNVLALIENLIYRWKPRMTRYNVKQKIFAVEEIPIVRGDQRALEQVFTNIIQNAINAMKGTGGILTIRIAPEKSDTPKKLNIDIADSGPGIPKEIVERIFDPFFSTNKDGNGLGLAITQQIINAHNGQIKVNSVPGGTVFRISLPISVNNNPS